MIYFLKNILALVLFCFAFTSYSFSAPKAFFDYKVFYSPETGPYIETYFDFAGNSITYKATDDSLLQGKVQILMLFKQGENIVLYDKKDLYSPKNSDSVFVDFLDQQRFPLPNGAYTLEVELWDVYAEDTASSKIVQPLEVEISETDIVISDIQLISAFKKAEGPGTFTKAGYDMLPYVSDFINQNMNEIIFYTEVYNTEQRIGEEGMFAMTFYFEDFETLQKVPGIQRFSRKTAASVLPFFSKVPVEELPSGTYNLVVEARDTENKLLAKRKLKVNRNRQFRGVTKEAVDKQEIDNTFVMAYKDPDVLMDYINSLIPVAADQEQRIIDNAFGKNYSEKLQFMRQFFYSFWKERNAQDPQQEWQDYKAKVEAAEEEYGTRNKRGYATDRGRVFLQYGAPDDITDRQNEPNSYPYQIWRYYKADRWNNVKFIFYDPQLTGQDYELLHVEYIPGERRNPQWKAILQSRNRPVNRDNSNENNHFGSGVDQFWDSPR